MEEATEILFSHHKALEEARLLLSDIAFTQKLRRLLDLLDTANKPDELINWYMGNDFTDLQMASFKNTWAEEDKIWDNV